MNISSSVGPVRHHFKRLFSALPSQPIKLSHRKLLELKGPDGCGFLQGLVTADVVSPTRVVQYGMLLNTQGRVLYDVILYHMGNERVWLECDTDAINDVVKHMRKYLLRSKVVTNYLSDIEVFADINGEPGEKYNEVIRASDPRSSLLGDRLLIGSDTSLSDMNINEYHRHRITHGVPEGIKELPPGQCLPFEVNLDLMKGVSFTKGCYIGQELTSRTFHTGVLRKRTLPLKLNHKSPVPVDIPWGSKIMSSSGKGQALGKIIATDSDNSNALAILRLTNFNMDDPVFIMSGDEGGSSIVPATCIQPSWWSTATE